MNDDLISRKWLMECVEEGWIKFETEKDENKFIHLVRDTAPSAQPERPKGKWIKKLRVTDTEKYISYDSDWYCSRCGTKYDPVIAKIVNLCMWRGYEGGHQ